MPFTNYILSFTLLATFLTCCKLKRKGQNLIESSKEKVSETKQKISEKKNQLVDKVFPKYDIGKPDTESNKKRFTEHLQVDLSDDVKNIYAYGDFIGVDYKVLISFNCEPLTISKIATAKNMILSTENDEGLSFLADFTWWQKEIIAKIKPYKVVKEYEYWQYLWYDSKKNKAYYEEFSL